MIKRKNIYIIGNILGAYRSQAILSVLINSNKYNVNFCNYTVSNISNKTFLFVLKTADIFLASLFRLYFLIRADIVLVLPMNNNKFIQVLLARIFRKKIVADFYISYYDTRVIDRKTTPENSIKANLYRAYDINLLKASKTFFLNQSEAIYYTQIVQSDKKFEVNSVILPLCMDARTDAKLNFFKGNSSKDINICWWGTFIPLHGLDKIIEAALILKENNIKFKLHLFGDSFENAKPFQKMIIDKRLDSFVKLYSDYSFSNGNLETFLIDKCDIALGAFGDSVKAKIVITNKVIDALSMKIPVVTCYSLGIQEYFENNIDLFLSENTPNEIAATIIEISKRSSYEIECIVNSGYEKFNSIFSYSAFKTKIIKELENV